MRKLTVNIYSVLQAQIQCGEREGELRFRIAWSKVTKRHAAEPVLEPKDHSYLQDMLCDSIQQTESVSSGRSQSQGVITRKPKDTRHIMAPPQKPPRQEIIKDKIVHSRFKKKTDSAESKTL